MKIGKRILGGYGKMQIIEGFFVFQIFEMVLKLGTYFAVILLCIKAINALNIYINNNRKF